MRHLLFALGQWLVRRFAPQPLVITQKEIRRAVFFAAQEVGLHAESLNEGTDLSKTGKAYEVLHHAAKYLERDHELTTVRDVMDWLMAAPPKDR